MKQCPICAARHSDDAQFCPHDGATLVAVGAASADPLVGQVLAGRYEILSKLGEGGMGSVYSARHRRLGRVDAVKILRPDAANAEAARRFLREAKLAASINHPNAVVIHDFGEAESGAAFLAMEYIQGQPLSKLLQKQGPLPAARVVAIVRQIASALDAAHRLGVIHRDLKPDNIMIMDGDRVKVVDFGIAKAVGGEESVVPMTQVGFVIGTPQYMSPEQVMGEPLDARSDVYSLALVTYEMLTGAPAFPGDSSQAQMVARVSEQPRPMAAAAPQVAVPAAVEAVVRQALAVSPAHRPASAGAFAAQLERALSAVDGTQAMAASAAPRPSTQPQGPTVGTAGARSPAETQPAIPVAADPFRPPPAYASAAGPTVVQPPPTPTPDTAWRTPYAAPQSAPTLPPNVLATPTRGGAGNVWLIGGLLVFAGVVLLALVGGLVFYFSLTPDDGAPPAVAAAPDAAATLRESRALREVGEYDKALRLVDERLAANPTSPELRIEKAEILFEQERFVESEDIVYAVLKSHPDYGPAYQNLGVLKWRQNKIEEAIANQKRCLELNPEPEYACYAHSVLANIYAGQYFSNKRKYAARADEAEMEARSALATATRKSLEIYPRLTLVALFIDRRQYALAREQVDKVIQDGALRRNQDKAAVYGQAAVIAFYEKRYADAAEAAELAAQFDPENKEYRKLANALRRYRRRS